jgi:hypothetical protein
MKHFLFVLLAVVWSYKGLAQCVCCGPSTVPAGMFSSSQNGTLTLPIRSVRTELLGEWRCSNVNTTIYTASAHYGLTRNLTASLMLPYVAAPRSSMGLADLTLLSGYALYNSGAVKTSISAGVELPTGSSAIDSINGGIALGSGTFDPLIGFTAAVNKGKLTAIVSAMYKRSMENAAEMNAGDLFSHRIGIMYKPGNESCADSLSKRKRPAFITSIAASGEWLGEQTHNIEITAPSSYTVFTCITGALGIGSWSFPVEAALPIYSTSKTARDLRFKAGIIYSFTLNNKRS